MSIATELTIAKELRGQFVRRERHKGGRLEDYFYSLKDDAPEWMTDWCRACHESEIIGCILPDDIRFDFIVEALDEIISNQGDMEDACSNIEASVYTAENLQWLSSRLDRYAFCDEAIAQDMWNSADGSTATLIAQGEQMERLEVFHTLQNLIQERVDEMERSA